jgi:hypothetical protein
LRRHPFEPFRLVTSDATVYEVRHPELVVPTLSSAFVGYQDPQQPGVAMRYDIVSLRHVIRIEPIELRPDLPNGDQPSTPPAPSEPPSEA